MAAPPPPSYADYIPGEAYREWKQLLERSPEEFVAKWTNRPVSFQMGEILCNANRQEKTRMKREWLEAAERHCPITRGGISFMTFSMSIVSDAIENGGLPENEKSDLFFAIILWVADSWYLLRLLPKCAITYGAQHPTTLFIIEKLRETGVSVEVS